MPRLRHLLVLLLLTGCTPTLPTAPPESPAGSTPSSSLGLHWVRSSAEYRAILLQTYALAAERLEQKVAGQTGATWAVALDADETVISNSLYQKELYEQGGAYSRESWNAWTRRQEATALPGAREFLERARQLGGKIAIVTNRRAEVCAETEANFRALKLPFDVILCRTDDRRKEPRWESVQKGSASPDLPPLEIVMWLGDNIEDFPAWDQEKRTAGDFSDFGDRFFVIPNPMYGSWESAAFGGQWKLDSGARRQKKLEAMSYWPGPN
jgi:5'-nucleotidase (lipoprotein e(P4) family)